MRANVLKRKTSLKIKRKRRIRVKTSGCTTPPRISVFKSNRTLCTQAVDDVKSITLAAAGGHKLGIRANKDGAKKIGAELAEVLKAQKIEQGVSDRSGHVHHEVIAALAEPLRENGVRL